MEKFHPPVLNEGSDEFFVTCLSNNSDKIGKPIKNCLDLFINTSLNHVSSRFFLISQPNKKLNSNNEQLLNAKDLSPITFGVILPPKLCGKNSTNSQINPVTSDENKISKVRTIKILLMLVHQLYIRKYCTNVTKFLKIKRINGQLWQGPIILLL